MRLIGKHQQFNAELSSAVLKQLGVDDRTIRRSLASITIPCRMEIIRKNPTVILDGAHNVTKMQSVTDAIRDLTHRRVYLIIALTKKRNPAEVFKNITRLADHVIVTYFQSSEQRCAAPLDVVKKIQTKHRAEILLDAAQALDRALALAGQKDIIIVTGSFYLAGELRKRWRSETKILTERIS
jgi:dihydrofolate synthase/folylpolyglutamate synthase